VDFTLPASGGITTTSADSIPGPGFTLNAGSNYGRISGGQITSYLGNLVYATGVEIGNLPGYSATSDLLVDGTSGGAVLQGAGTTLLGTLQFQDVIDRTLVIGAGRTLQLGATGGILRSGNAGNVVIGDAGNAGDLTTGTLAGADLVLTNGNASGTLTVNSVIRNNAGGAVDVIVNGNAGATTVLAGANTYTGTTIVQNGALRLVSNTAAGTTAGGITVQNNAVLELGNSIDVGNESLSIIGTGIAGGGAFRSVSGNNIYRGAITFSGSATVTADAGSVLTLDRASGNAITGGNNAVTMGGAGDIIVNDPITYGGTANGAFTKIGTGTLFLNAANTFSGTGVFTLNDGRVRISNGGALGGTSAGTSVTDNAALELLGNITTNESIVMFNSTGIGGTGAIRNLSGNNTITGVVTTDDGTSRVNSDSGTLTISGEFRGDPTSGQNRSATIGGAGNVTLSGVVRNGVGTPTAGILNLIKDGTGILTLGGNTNTYTGTTTVNNGVLRLDYGTNNNTKLADGAALVLGGGAVELSGGSHVETVGSTTLTAGTGSRVNRSSGSAVLALNTVTPGHGSLVDFSANGIATTDNLNTGGILGGWATVTIGGVTEWAVNSTNGPDGAITAYAGGYSDISRFLDGSPAGIVPDAALANVRIINGGTTGDLALAATATEINTLRMDASDGGATLAMAGSTLMIGGEAGGGIIQTATSGGLTIGTAINEGTLTTGGTANATAATLALINHSSTNDLFINSVIANNGNDVVGIAVSGGGRVVIGGANTATGAVSISNGSTLVVGSLTGAVATATLGDRAIMNHGTLVFRSSATGDIDSAAAISGSGSVQFLGTGVSLQSRYDVDNASTYTGGTTIDDSRVDYTAAGGFGTGMVNVLDGGQILVSAAIANPLTIQGIGWLETGGQLGALRLQTAAASLTGDITLAGNTRITATNAITGTIAGVIDDGAGTFDLEFGEDSATGTVVLSGSNTFGGNTTIAFGSVTAGHNSAFSTGSITLGGTRLNLSPGITLGNAITINTNTGAVGNGLIQAAGGTGTVNGPITINASPAAGGHFGATGGGTLFVNGPITSSVPVSSRLGNVVFGGGGTGYTSLQVGEGTVGVGAENGIATTAVVDIGVSGAGILDLRGFDQSLAGVQRTTSNAAGIQNSGPGTSTLTMNIAAPGMYSFAGSIGGNVNLIKTGPGTQTFSGSGSFTGTTRVNGGVLVMSAATLANSRGIDVGADGDGFFGMLADDAGIGLTLAPDAGLTLGGLASLGELGFQLGADTASSDHFVLSGSGTFTVGAGGGVISAYALPGFAGGSFDLVSGPNPVIGGSSLVLGSLPGGYTYTLDYTTDATRLTLVAAAAAAGDLFWRGDVNGSWSALVGGSDTNWATSADGLSGAAYNPGASNTVNFSATNAGAAPVITTLDNHFSIAGLNFLNSGTGAVTINRGSVGSLTVGGGGITVAAGAPLVHAIQAPLVLGANQSWTVLDSARTLVVGGVVSGSANLVKTGSGTVLLTGDNTFTGEMALNGGVLRVEPASNTTLGTGAATLLIQGGELQIASDSARNLARPTTISGNAVLSTDLLNAGPGVTHTLGTLAVGPHTVSVGGMGTAGSGIQGLAFGATTLVGSPVFNVSNNTGGATTALTLGLIGETTPGLGFTKNGDGMIILAGGASTFTGPVLLNQGTLRVIGASAGALGTGTASLQLAGGILELANSTARNYARPTLVTGNVAILTDRLTTGAGLTHTLGTLSIGSHTVTVNAGAFATSGTQGLTFGATTLTGSPTFTVNNNGLGATTLLTLGTVDTAGFSLSFDGSGSVTPGVISGTGSVVYEGSGTLNLMAAHSFDGGLTVKSGTAAGTNSSSAFGAGAITLGDSSANPASVTLTGFIPTANVANPIILASGTTGDITIASNNATTPFTYSGGVTGSNHVRIAANGSQTLTFSGADFNNSGSITNVGSGSGALVIGSNVGGNVTNLSQTSATSPLVLNGTTIAHTGSTNVSAGSLTINGNVTSTTGISVTGTGSSLSFTGGLTGTGITSLTVDAGATLSLLDGLGSAITGLTSLNLGGGGTGTVTLNLNVGDGATDTLTLLGGNSPVLGNTITFNLADAGLSANTQYTLLHLVDGGITAFGIEKMIQGAMPGGFDLMNWTVTNNVVRLTTGNLIGATLYWRGLTNTAWNGNDNNWSTDKAGTIPAGTVPGQISDVFFAYDGAAGAVNTTLEQNFRIKSLTFEAGATTPASVTIAPGTLATNRLEVTGGVSVTAGGPASVAITAPFRIGGDQAWNVADAAATLTFSGGLQGNGDLTKTGAGRVVLAAAANAAFNTLSTTDVTVTGGVLELTHSGALGTSADANLANVVINGGAFYFNNATSGTVANPIVLGGGTLSAGGNAQTYSGPVTLAAATSSFINLRDSNSATITTTQRDITLGGQLGGSGSLTLDSISTAGAGNQITGNLIITNGGNGGWGGDLNVLRGTVIARSGNGDALGSGAINMEFGKIEWEGAGGDTYNLAKNLTISRAGGNAVGEWNIDRTSGTGAFVVNHSGTVTLGGAGGTGELRVFLADQDNSVANFTGSVVLANNAAIHVRDNASLAIATISGIISETGGSRTLIVNGPAGGGTDWGGTDGILRLTGPNSFTGNVTLGGGTLEFNTVTDAGGGASALGNGTAITSTANGVLRFIGTTAQSTNRPITATAGTLSLSANGDEAADTITYDGAINTGANNLVLTGAAGRAGIITGGVTQTGDTADLTVNGGTWTHASGTSRVGDDMTITGADVIMNLNSGLWQVRDDLTVTAGAILNLNATGVLSFNTPTLSPDAQLNINNGGVVNLGANGAVVATEFDRLFIGQSGGGALPGTLNMGAFNLTTSRLILGERLADREGLINGTGTLTVTGGDIDLFEGTINAALATTGSTAFEKFGPDTVTLSGDNSGLASTGATIVYEGTLLLDYTASNTVKIREASQLSMIGGNLVLNGNASAATSQSVGSFTLGSGGAGVITLNGGTGRDIVLNLGAMTRALNAQDGTLRMVLPSGTQTATNGITTTTTTVTNGILGTAAFATVEDGTGTWFATRNTAAGAQNIVALVSTPKNDPSTWVAGDHVTDENTGYSGVLGRQFGLGSLRFNSAAGSDLDLGAAGHLRIASGGILVTAAVGGSPSLTGGTLETGSFALPVAALGAPELIITQDSASVFEIGSSIHLNNSLVKSGSGTLLLSGTNRYLGYTEINQGTLQVSGGDAIGDTSLVTLASNRNSTLQLLSNEAIGRLAGGRRNDNSDYGMIDVGSHTLTINQSGSNTTYAGRFSGDGTIVRQGSHNLTLSGVSTGFTGAVVVNSGRFELSLTGAIGASAFTVNSGGVLLLNNNGATRSGTRIPDATPITLNSANGAYQGQTAIKGFVLITDQDDSNSETVGLVTANSGASYLTIEGTSANDDPNLTIASLARTSGATVNLRGTNLGTSGTQRGQIRIATTNEPAFIAALVGGGATAAGADNISIVPWAVGESVAGATGDGNMGNSLVTYQAGTGFRPLDLATEYANLAGALATDNVRESLGADLTGVSGTTVNSLVINNSAFAGLDVTGAGPGQSLAVTSGALLFTVTGGTAGVAYDTTLGGFDGGVSVGASNEYVFHVVNPSSAANPATLSATIASSLTSVADITKSGRGTLVLNQVNTAGGGARRTTINEGVLQISDLDQIGGNTGALVFAGGTLRLGPGFSDDLGSRTISFLSGGATLDTNGNSLVLATSIGGGGAGGFTKTGAGDLTLNAAASYSGATAFSGGTLTLGVNNALPAGTPLSLGSGGVAAILDTNGFDQTLGSLINATNSSVATTQVIIDPGNTLTVNGPVLIGADAAASTTLFTATGGGAFVQNQVGGTFQLGGGTGTTNTNAATADFSGLAGFTVNLGPTGVFRVGDNNANGSGSPATAPVLTLAGTSNAITAGVLGIGDAQGQGGTATLELGVGTNVIHADTLYIGSATTLARGSGSLVFGGAGGTLTLRGSSGGTSRADVAMTTSSFNTGLNQVNSFLTDGHGADLRIDTFLMSERNNGAGSVTSSFTFDTGILDIVTLVMSRRSGTGTGDSTSNVTLGGGAATIGFIDMAASTGTGAGSDSFATLGVSGGNVTIGTGSGTAINLANAGTGRTVTSNLNLTGGNVTVTGNIIRTGGAGVENETLTLDGAILDLSGNQIGTGATDVNFVARSGTLRNLGELNGGGTLNKSGTGTLHLDTANSYTGATTVSAGALHVSHGGALGGTTNGTSVSDGAVLELSNDITVSGEGLVLAGSGVSNTGALRSTSGDNTYTGNITLASAARIQSDADTLTLDAASGSAIAGTDVAVTFGGAGNIAVADAIATGTGGLTKEGTGILRLLGVNSFTGATSLNEGTLIVNGSLAATANDLTVADNAILGGTGTIGANAVLNGDLRTGTTAANGSVGTLTFTDPGAANPGVGFGATGTWLVDLIEGTSASDRLAMEGNLLIDPAAILSFNVLTGTPFSTSSVFTLATYGGSLSGAFSGWTNNGVYTIGGGDYIFSYGTGSNSAITLTAVPEPGTLGLLGLALGGFFARRLRKRRAEAAEVAERGEA
jgi:autotransporter-associated beta strand protein